MNKIITFLISVVLLTSIMLGQTYDLQFIEVANAGSNGGNYDVKVQIKASSQFKLATSNITFNFNGDGLSSPSLLTAHNFSGVYGGTPFIYVNMGVTEPLPNQVASINIVFTQTEAFADVVPTTWKDVATIRFVIDDITKTSQFAFRSASPAFTAVYKIEGTSTTQLVAGSSTLDNPLPVELTSFSANAVEGTKAQLNWETATEVNNYGFEVERSIKTETVKGQPETESKWEKVGFVKGNGNSNSTKVYSFTDKNLVGGSKFLYRLKQIDIDGKFEYSEAVEIEVLPTKYELMQNYPNPFNPNTNIKFSLPEDAKVSINVYNVLGEKVASVLNGELKAGFHEVNFGADSFGYQLSSGVYLYTIESKNFTQVKKMILMK